MLSNPLTIQGRGTVFFHPKPRKNACQSRPSTRPPQTTATNHHALRETEKARTARDTGVGGGFGHRVRGISDAAGEVELPEVRR